jgi:PKD repeat protein
MNLTIRNLFSVISDLKRFKLFAAVLLVYAGGVLAQTGHQRVVTDLGLQGIEVSWQFDGITTHLQDVEGVTYQYVRIKDFTFTKEVGRPALPCYQELIAIPRGAVPQIRILSSTYTDIPAPFPVHPALKPATDTYGAPEPDFEIDRLFYQTDQFSPGALVSFDEMQSLRELSFGVFGIYPVQYNPVTGVLRVYSSLHFAVDFPGATDFLDVNQHSEHFLSSVAAPFLNGGSVLAEIQQEGIVQSGGSATPNYIIITHDNYMLAAERLAAWKTQMGYEVEIINGTGMTSANIKSEVHTRYHAWTPKPDYLLIIGDHPDIPGQVIVGSYGTFASDLYYVCTGSGNDYVADMARGRISVSTATEANNVVTKIIQYEQSPPQDSAFYTNSVHAAYFQHASNGYAERRFAQTAEELRSYMVNTQGYNVTRVYYTESTVNPTNWNNGYYAAGEPIPSYLLKPTFPWTGNATQINAALNSGAFYILHRDHGYETGWGDPAYSNANVNALNNGNKTPVVFTINCLTGKYYYGECFSERFLRKYPGGAVGVFGHAEISLSGYNDALAFGLFDAIWANPGAIPVFTGSGGINLTNPVPHPKIFNLGDVVNHGLIRMTQTWGAHQYTNELLHYFGDPAMRIFTRKPLPIAAVHPLTLQCGADTSLVVNSSNCTSGLVTLVVDDELIWRGSLSNGTANLNFPQLSGTFAILTISDTNRIPYVDTIIITGGCPKSKFGHQAANYCTAEPFTFTSQSTGTITSYMWNFGAGASPATATGQGPHVVNYVSGGTKTVTLTVTGTSSHVSSAAFGVDSLCKFIIPATGTDVVTHCTGVLQDDGGELNYSNGTTGTVTISPAGASAVNLLFHTFSFENNNDYLYIYNGPNTSSPLIGSYTGNALPGTNGMISSTTGSITLKQVTNASNNYPGFRLSFQCAYPNSAPQTNFILSDSNICSGQFTFTDLSFNGPSGWKWYFGDGNISTQQHPTYVYQQNGTFSVALVTTNAFGTDSVIKHGFVQVNMPVAPVAPSVGRCKAGKVALQAAGNGTIQWFDQPTGGTPIGTGNTFITPVLNQTTSYYAQSIVPSPLINAGKSDNTGDGAYLAYEHYLVFNAMIPFNLNSVKVYAQSAGSRTIQLRSSAGTTLQTITQNVPAGTSRVNLNFQVPAGTNLRLVCSGTPNLYRNSGGLSYPYVIPGILSIHSSSASTNPTGYYYYFYEWEVQEDACMSARTQVDAIISDSLKPAVVFNSTVNTNQVQFNNQSTNADSYLWQFGDGGSSTLQHPFYVYQTPATYQVVLHATNDCGTDSTSQSVAILTGIHEPSPEHLFAMYPNPATDQVFVVHYSPEPGTVMIRISDPAGRLLRTERHDCVAGPNTIHLNLQGIPAGAWLLQIEGPAMNRTEKLIVSPR